MLNEIIVAEKLMQAGTLKLQINNPFTWASGWKSPVYCDNRSLLSYTYIRNYIKNELSNLVLEKFSNVTLIAGVATAGIPWGVLVADQLKLPFIYVRPKPKVHGLGKLIEGFYNVGDKTVIIEDLISTGSSSLQVAEILLKEKLELCGLGAIFTYGFKVAIDNFNAVNLPFFTLTNYQSLISLAIEKKMITTKEEETLLNWRLDPANWG